MEICEDSSFSDDVPNDTDSLSGLVMDEGEDINENSCSDNIDENASKIGSKENSYITEMYDNVSVKTERTEEASLGKGSPGDTRVTNGDIVTRKSSAAPKPFASKRPRQDHAERKILLAQAVKDVQEQNISMRKASMRYNLAKSSLCDYVRKNNIPLPSLRIKSENSKTAKKASVKAKHTNGSSKNSDRGDNNPPPPLTKQEVVVTNGVSTIPPGVTQLLFTSTSTDDTMLCIPTSALTTSPQSKNKPRLIAPKTQRLESPWSGSTGLPTQVPMQSWGVLSSSETKLKPLVFLQSQETLNSIIDCTIPMAPISSPEDSPRGHSKDTKSEKDTNPPDSDTAQLHVQNAKELIGFISKVPTPFHAVKQMRVALLEAGYKEISESDPWMLQANNKVFFTREQSSELVALAIGGQYKPSSGFTVIGCSNDTPCLKLKPQSWWRYRGSTVISTLACGPSKSSSWIDRELGVAGRCFIRTNGCIEQRLVHIDWPILRIPSPSQPITSSQSNPLPQSNGFGHKDRGSHSSGTSCDNGSPLLAIMCSTVQASQIDSQHSASFHDPKYPRYPPSLLSIIADELKVDTCEIVDMELFLTDTQNGIIGGVNSEYLFSSRLTNVFNVYSVIESLISTNSSLWSESNIRVAYMFKSPATYLTGQSHSTTSPHPEISASTDWLNSLRESILPRVTASLHASGLTRVGAWVPDLQAAAIARSYALWAHQSPVASPDTAEEEGEEGHLCNGDSERDEDWTNEGNGSSEVGYGTTRYKEVQKQAGSVQLNGGIVIRLSPANLTACIVREIAALADVPTQDLILSYDSSSHKSGLPVLQVGGAVASLNSCREMMAVSSVTHAFRLYRTFFENYPQINVNFKCTFE